jgi:chaperonin GroEL (HSP60 family)
MLKDNVPVNGPLYFIKARADVEGQRACQRASLLYQSAEAYGVEMMSKAMTEIHAQVAEKATRDRKAAIQKLNDKMHVRSTNFQVSD